MKQVLLEFLIEEKWDNMMIIDILRDQFQFSNRLLRKIKIEHGFYLNGIQVFSTTRVKTGDKLIIISEEEGSESILPQEIPLNIVYEDENLLVLNKPAGMAVHPTKGHYLNTLANGVVHYWQQQNLNYRFRPVNRLDLDTSGLVVIAKSQYAHQQLSLQLLSRNMKRYYLAFISGEMPELNGTIDLPILKDPNHPVKRIIDVTGQKALTFYNTVANWGDYSLVNIHLATGRTHQIRIHFSALNHPLLGDIMYGGKELCDFQRQALHAYRVEFFHPLNKNYLSFTIPLPDDFQNCLHKLQGDISIIANLF